MQIERNGEGEVNEMWVLIFGAFKIRYFYNVFNCQNTLKDFTDTINYKI